MNKGYQSNMPMNIDWLDEDDQERLTSRLTANGIADLEQIAASTEEGQIAINQSFCNHITQRVYIRNGWLIHRAWLRIPNAQIHALLSIIRTKLLDLLLKLDELGPSALIPSLLTQPHVKERIDQAVQSIVAPNGVVNLNYGNYSQQTSSTGNSGQLNIAQGSHATQSINNASAIPLPELLSELKTTFAADANLAEQQEEISDELKRIEVQLKKPEPKKSILTRSVETLQEIAKGGASAHTLGGLLLKAYEQLQTYA